MSRARGEEQLAFLNRSEKYEAQVLTVWLRFAWDETCVLTHINTTVMAPLKGEK